MKNYFILSVRSFGALLLFVCTAFAADPAIKPLDSKKSMNSNDASAANLMMAQLLVSIDRASIDFETVGTFDSKTGYNAEFMKGTGMVKFNSDWEVPLTSQKNNEIGKQDSNEVDKFIPILKMDAKNLIARVTMDQQGLVTAMDLDFYKGYDKIQDKWIARPLSVSAANQFNKELMNIKFNWVHVKIVRSSDPSLPASIEGQCSSTKEVLDIITGEIQPIDVQCQFDGTYSADNYSVHFKYINSTPSAERILPKVRKP